MSAQVLDCKVVAQAIKDECKAEAEALKAKGITPKLGIVRVGEKGPDLSYEKGATKTMNEAGIEVEVFAMPADVSQEDYIKKFREINADPTIHGILAFRRRTDTRPASVGCLRDAGVRALLRGQTDGLSGLDGPADRQCLDERTERLAHRRRQDERQDRPERRRRDHEIRVLRVVHSREKEQVLPPSRREAGIGLNFSSEL